MDVGGGQGALLHGILCANPKLHGVLFDQPSVVAGAESLRTGAIAQRCEIVGGDFFQAVPEGADAYLMRVVLHDWNEPQQSLFEPAKLAEQVRKIGFAEVSDFGPDEAEARYFKDRTDALRPLALNHYMRARVGTRST